MDGKTAPQTGARFQVLALDGGGVRGIYTAALLAGLERDLGRPVTAVFDLVVGTSVGGIIALGLGAGMAPEEILTTFLAERTRIFPNSLGWGRIRRPFVAKYRPQGLEAALRGILGQRLLGESQIPLVIPSYNLGENDVYLFKTPHHVRLRRDFRVPMWAVGMATTAAPTYFPAFPLPGDQVRLIDGGIWANNPAMVGVTEAVSMFGQELSAIRVLSLGTTSTVQARRSRLDNAGLLRWAVNPSVIDICLHGQSVGAFAEVQHLLGKDHAHRLAPSVPDQLGSLDSCNPGELVAKAAHFSRAFSPIFDEVFGSHTTHSYVPLHGPNTHRGDHVSVSN